MPSTAHADRLDSRQLLDVLTAMRKGDFTVRMDSDHLGVAGKIADTLNEILEMSAGMSAELARVADVVGKQGRLSQRAHMPNATGGWAGRLDSVNALIGDLVQPTNEVIRVIGAVARGDLSQKMALQDDAGQPIQGEFLRTAQIANTMVDQLSSFASEVTRVAREVGTEGKLGGQAEVRGVSGTWKDLTENVNSMASNLTAQVRNIADVTTAVAKGDLSRKITVDVRGEILELKNTINVMVDQLSSFASEVTRVAREVGTEGKLGGQAVVKGVSGTWKDLTDNVNSMASNLTAQVRNIADVTTAVAKGDLSKKITVEVSGEILQLKNTINVMVDQLSSFASEVTRVAREVGTEGRLGGQAEVGGVSGTWRDLTESVNSMASNLTAQVRNIADVTTAVARGDLSRKITVEVRGEILALKNTINVMVDQLSSFASEVTRVARDVGTEGKLGGQAVVKGVSGTWKDLTDNVNWMASNLTDQVRGIATVVTAVASGDLRRKLALSARGEIAALAETINGMIDTLATFADQVTGVAREVGIEGKLGGQAVVPSAAGTWRDLTDNVNQLAANLTNQVRAIAEVATAVTEGDLTRSIAVSAQGEVAALKDNINQMIANLRATTQKNTEQDWLKTNLARFTGMLQGQRDLETVSRLILKELAPLVNAQQGVFYVMDAGEKPVLKLLSSYAYRERKGLAHQFAVGDGLVGQCALEKERIVVTDVPDDYIQIGSGLGAAPPRAIVVMPVLFEGQVKAVVELASFHRFSDVHLAFLDQLTESIGIVLNTIAAGMRTEVLLRQSQSLAQELQAQQQELTETNRQLEQQAKSLQASEERLKLQQEELQRTNEELEERSRLLQAQNSEVERKNREIEHAKLALEDRAQQLALSSKYKSEFLANMSHELRTPLNSLLILAKLLADNPDGNLDRDQVEFANTIYSSGADLLALINDILDLSKIEAGAMQVDVGECDVRELREFVERSFAPVAEQRGVAFRVEVDPRTPRSIWTDTRRLQQVLKNLLSNAFKFTERGEVVLDIAPAESGWTPGNASLDTASPAVALSVRDTGIGIPKDKQRIIFEAFQQLDGTATRKYGGTGLGLAITREIARLLGGEVVVSSEPGQGSTFTFYLPHYHLHVHAPPKRGERAADRAEQVRSASPEPPRPAPAVLDRVLSGSPPPARNEAVAVTRPPAATVLIVAADPGLARLAVEAARDLGFAAIHAPTADIAVQVCRERRPDAVAIHAEPDADASVLVSRFEAEPGMAQLPMHVFTAARQDEDGIETVLADHLRDEMALFLHRVEAELPERRRQLQRAAALEPPLAGRKVLVVDDDVRNVFAVTALLERHGVQVLRAESAAQGLELLRTTDGVELVIMDVMMPDMDGYAAMKEIRSSPRLERLPIIALTAKAMKGDREKCLDAGASDYITKPVENEQLLSLVRVWLYGAAGNKRDLELRV